MDAQQFEYIRQKRAAFQYSSLDYVDFESISDFTLAVDRDDLLLLYGTNRDIDTPELHWAANDWQPLFSAAQSTGRNILVTFVPPQWHDELAARGFEEYGVLREYWLSDIAADADAPLPQLLQPADCAQASDVTMACRWQSREFRGESETWVLAWLSGADPAAGTGGSDSFAVLGERVDGVLAGIACVAIYARESESGAVLWLREVAVRPEYQNRGIGRNLVRQALRYGRERGAQRAFLMADELNEAAKKLYASCGFTPNPNGLQIDMIYLPQQD